ncbi:MAG: PilX N-terminal domain-containing pilus assembly protein [Salinisphaera sp.]|jgi:type IV pilus assembly protein PilX|nr:PilX N-terminal domain-containing pilus assembly protein [Salinisphaera sp.]
MTQTSNSVSPSSDRSSSSSQRGFVLVTSLIFLVIITLIAVSAINSSTLQERMASNLRDKSDAFHDADAALRSAELKLALPLFDTYQSASACYDVSKSGTDSANNNNGSSSSSSCTGSTDLYIWNGTDNELFGGSQPVDESLKFLDPSLWRGTATAQIYTAGDGIQVKFFVEEDRHFTPSNLNPDTAATAQGKAIYRITARAQGRNPAAVAVVQSFYEKDY